MDIFMQSKRSENLVYYVKNGHLCGRYCGVKFNLIADPVGTVKSCDFVRN